MTHRLLKHVHDVIRGTAPLGKLRSPHWATVEHEFKATSPDCAVCGTEKKIEVHHKKPFHLHPELELDPKNLISLCRIHHQWWGHLGDWKSFNPEIEADAADWARKIEERPEGEEAA
jgi:5-methylcytosine-specific restriction enzyme A